MSKQATSEQIEQVPTNGDRQCSGCHRRNADLTLFENSKLYCSSCATNVVRLGIAPVMRDAGSAPTVESDEPTDLLESSPETESEHDDDTESEEEQMMASQPVQPEEIAVMPSLATSSVEMPSTPSTAPAPSADVSLHGVLTAERARLLEQRNELDRRFRADVEAIDSRLEHVESLLGDQPESRAS